MSSSQFKTKSPRAARMLLLRRLLSEVIGLAVKGRLFDARRGRERTRLQTKAACKPEPAENHADLNRLFLDRKRFAARS